MGSEEERLQRLQQLKEPWAAYLQKHRLNTSQAREAVVDAFLCSSGHVEVQDILDAARKQNPRVGLTTVYRTLKLLQEAGLAHARQFAPGKTLYEVAMGRAHHDHLICESCGHIIEFENSEIEQLQEETARQFGFSVNSHRHELFGLCEKARGISNGYCPAESKDGGHRRRSNSLRAI